MPTAQAKIGRFSETSAITEWMDFEVLATVNPKTFIHNGDSPGVSPHSNE
jgi:hypothetical protein